MKHPVKITFRDIDPSPAITEHIEKLTADLDSVFHSITSCQVTVEAPHRHKNQGKLYHVSILMRVPEGELVVSRGNDENHAHEDVYVAIRDSFDAIKRQLIGYSEKIRGDVKKHSL